MTGFEHPSYLYFLAGIPILLLLYIGWRVWRLRALQRLGDAAVMRTFLPVPRFEWLRVLLWAGGLCLLVLAWANPQGGTVLETTSSEQADVMIAIDVSNSMRTKDVSPDRLELARIFSRQLIEQLEGERLGLIFFAGEASLQMPLSQDAGAATILLRNADPGAVTTPGTNIAQAVALAQRSFRAGGSGGGRALILITDCEDHEGQAEEVVKDAYDEGTITFVVGVGTTRGGPIPLGEFGFKRDEQGNPVISKLDPKLLARLAAAGGGRAFDLRRSNATLSELVTELGRLDKRSVGVLSLAETQSFYQWFLLPGFVLLLASLVLPKLRYPNTED